MANNYLVHYGVIGMRWGVRRYQNKDGSLTSLGRRKAKKEIDKTNKYTQKYSDAYKKAKANTKFYTNSKTGNLIKVSNKRYESYLNAAYKKYSAQLNKTMESLKNSDYKVTYDFALDKYLLEKRKG